MSNSNNKLLEPWEILSSETAFETPLFRIQKYFCKEPVGHKPINYYVYETPDSVMCVCITEDGRVVLERQFRLPMKGVSMDYPAGSVKSKDNDFEQAALRELREETGFVVDKITHLVSLAKDPGFSSGKMHVFLATGGRKVDNDYNKAKFESKDEFELVVVDLLTPSQVLNAVKSGEISCAFCVAASLYAAQHLGWGQS